VTVVGLTTIADGRDARAIERFEPSFPAAMLSLVVAPVDPYVASPSTPPWSLMGELEQPMSSAASIGACSVATATNKKRNESFISVLLNPDFSLTTKDHE
jgi:hypothetical protein